jgi:hypothetical protein
MIKKIAALVLMFGVVFGAGLMAPVSAHAIGATTSPIAAQCAGVTDSTVCGESTSTQSLAKNIVNTLLYVIGAISVIMLIVGGLFYVTSAGDSGRVTIAKNTITGAIIGLVISILAFAIVQFVFTRFK